MSLGSGFIISDDGYVVTNDHVVDKGQSMTVILDDGTEYKAKVIGVDEKTDLALLKINNADRKFTYVKFAEDTVRVGDWVVAVGNPFGLGGTVTAGIVSASGRDIGAGPYDDFIQIDAAVNRGNSGGPAFNLNGEVIGVNTAIFSPSGGNVGIAFAIPAHMAERVIAELKDDGSSPAAGSASRSSRSTRISPTASASTDQGALVTEAQSDSPAAKAGIKSGDTILAVDGKEVKGPRELALMIAEHGPGATAKVTYWRDGKKPRHRRDARHAARRAGGLDRATVAGRRSSPRRSRTSAWPSPRPRTMPASSSPTSTRTARPPSAAFSPAM